jgi:hypothetical protein
MARQKARGKRQEARGKSEEGLGDFTSLYTVWFYCVHLLSWRYLLLVVVDINYKFQQKLAYLVKNVKKRIYGKDAIGSI